MITFKISRDQARIVEERFMPYMVMVADMKLCNAGTLEDQLKWKMIRSLILDVQLAFKKKLLNSAVKLTFKLTDAHAAAFYKFLMQQPINGGDIYILNFRQHLCDCIFKQLIEPIPAEPEYTF